LTMAALLRPVRPIHNAANLAAKAATA